MLARRPLSFAAAAGLAGLLALVTAPAASSATTTLAQLQSLIDATPDGGTVTLDANITGSTTDALVISNKHITLDLFGNDLVIEQPSPGSPAIRIATDGHLTIIDTLGGGHATVTGGDGAPGVGGSSGTTGTAGTDVAPDGLIGGDGTAGDPGEDAGDLTIAGGTVAVTGGAGAPGVGGGKGGDGGRGGSGLFEGGLGGAGGSGGSGGTVTIEGGAVTITGGVSAPGLGGGTGGAGGTGGPAPNGNGGPAGTGGAGGEGASLTVNGGTVAITGGSGAPGVGGGTGGHGGAGGTGGSDGGTGGAGGSGGTAGDAVIAGGIATVTGGAGAPGVGGGQGGAGGTGGNGFDGGAGGAGGDGGNGSGVIVEAGAITVEAGSGAPTIGAGSPGAGGPGGESDPQGTPGSAASAGALGFAAGAVTVVNAATPQGAVPTDAGSGSNGAAAASITWGTSQPGVAFTLTIATGAAATFDFSYIYVASFDFDNGTGPYTQLASYGDTIDQGLIPTDRTKDGHSLDTWTSDTGMALTDPVVAPVTFTALWTPIPYDVTFVYSNGGPDTVTPTDYGTAVAAPSDPTRPGWTFAGWVSDTGIAIGDPIEQATVFTAQWTFDGYTPQSADISGLAASCLSVPGTAYAGDDIDVTVCPYDGDADLWFMSTPVALASAVALSPSGGTALTLTIPADAAPGTHHLVAYDPATGEVLGFAPIEILSEPEPELAATGPESGWLIALAAAFAALGVLFVTRRRV